MLSLSLLFLKFDFFVVALLSLSSVISGCVCGSSNMLKELTKRWLSSL